VTDECLPSGITRSQLVEIAESPLPEHTAVNATHLLVCTHVCRWSKTYMMPCHILKAMPDGRLKLLVFGERNWKGREHISRVRYVEAWRVKIKPAPAAE